MAKAVTPSLALYEPLLRKLLADMPHFDVSVTLANIILSADFEGTVPESILRTIESEEKTSRLGSRLGAHCIKIDGCNIIVFNRTRKLMCVCSADVSTGRAALFKLKHVLATQGVADFSITRIKVTNIAFAGCFGRKVDLVQLEETKPGIIATYERCPDFAIRVAGRYLILFHGGKFTLPGVTAIEEGIRVIAEAYRLLWPFFGDEAAHDKDSVILTHSH